MDNIRTLLVTVLINIIHIKTLGQEHIQLDRDHGVLFSVHVLCLNIKLWTVERSLSCLLCIFHTDIIQDLTHRTFYTIPFLSITKILVRMLRIPLGHTIGNIFLQSQCLQTIFCQTDTILKLVGNLLRCTDQMSLRDRKLTDTGQTVHLTGILVTEESRCLTHTIRKVTV